MTDVDTADTGAAGSPQHRRVESARFVSLTQAAIHDNLVYRIICGLPAR